MHHRCPLNFAQRNVLSCAVSVQSCLVTVKILFSENSTTFTNIVPKIIQKVCVWAFVDIVFPHRCLSKFAHIRDIACAKHVQSCLVTVIF